MFLEHIPILSSEYKLFSVNYSVWLLLVLHTANTNAEENQNRNRASSSVRQAQARRYQERKVPATKKVLFGLKQLSIDAHNL